MKTIILLLLFIPSYSFGWFLDNEEHVARKFQDNNSDIIINYYHMLDKKGIKYGYLLETPMTYVTPKKYSCWKFNLKAGQTYIFKIMSNGPAIKAVLVYPANGRTWILGDWGNKYTAIFTAPYSGEYNYYVYSRDMKRFGLHYTYVIYLK